MMKVISNHGESALEIVIKTNKGNQKVKEITNLIDTKGFKIFDCRMSCPECSGKVSAHVIQYFSVGYMFNQSISYDCDKCGYSKT